MPIHLTNRQRRFPVDAARLRRHAAACLTHHGLGPGELSILLLNDRAMRVLNRDHRGIDGATDVLSFPMFEGEPEAVLAELRMAPEEDRLVGDVVISVETAQRQAKAAGVLPEAELSLLLVHGFLHLLGYDHELGDEAARIMGRAEMELLHVLGVPTDGLVTRANQ